MNTTLWIVAIVLYGTGALVTARKIFERLRWEWMVREIRESEQELTRSELRREYRTGGQLQEDSMVALVLGMLWPGSALALIRRYHP